MKDNRYKEQIQHSLFAVGDYFIPENDFLFFKNIIEDRKSKYSASFRKILSIYDVKKYFLDIKKEKFYKKATHNIYAYRILLEDGSVLEGKNDDGELGGGNCILSVMRKENLLNSMIIITRYYGGIHLNSDRFKHLLNSTKYIIEKIKNKF